MSAAEDANRKVAEQLWEGVSTGDASILNKIVSHDLKWHTYGSGLLSGTFEGLEATLDLMASAGDLADSLQSELGEVFVNDHGVVLYYTVAATRGKSTLQIQQLLMLRITDGLITEAITVPVEQEESNAFWSRSG